MRIANIPANMWLTVAMQAAAPEVVYVGPAPQSNRQTRNLSTLFTQYYGTTAAYIYVLLHCDASAVYVGKTLHPVARFTKHRRREWWSEVYNLVLLRVEGMTQGEADMLALHVEALLIKHLAPSWNVQGVDNRPMNKRGVFA